ncbi:MAG: aspartate 1-decarboxylase [Cyanobacteria bacterium]|nr:aspartate 1-decarboxylase [Cyanobacteriota bacterium]
MLKTMLSSKIHRATVTECDLDYVGSITIDRDLMDAVGLLENEQVQILDITNGNRLTTYVIEGERSSGVIGINGAAAHLVSQGDLVIICSYVQIDEKELKNYKPQILLVDEQNKPQQKFDKELALTRVGAS